jgi:hypothetical protein
MSTPRAFSYKQQKQKKCSPNITNLAKNESDGKIPEFAPFANLLLHEDVGVGLARVQQTHSALLLLVGQQGLYELCHGRDSCARR